MNEKFIVSASVADDIYLSIKSLNPIHTYKHLSLYHIENVKSNQYTYADTIDNLLKLYKEINILYDGLYSDCIKLLINYKKIIRNNKIKKILIK